METNMNQISACQYLFDQEPKTAFPQLKADFVNESLKTIMKIVDHLVISNPEALFLFDPASCNNQCHLFSLINAQLVNQAMGIQQDKTPDKRFIYLSFFLSHAFLTNSKLTEKVACKALKAMHEKEPSKEFCSFIKDSDGNSLRAARAAINKLFTEHIQKILSEDEKPLYKELSALAKKDLKLISSNRKETVYTLPKFAGVTYFVDAIFKEKISLMFKVKVVTKEGNGIFTHMTQTVPSAPVVVFEMVATDGSLSFNELQKTAKKCPSFFQRNIKQNERHKDTDSCQFCAPQQINVDTYHEKLQPIFERSSEMLLALGADFVLQCQESFIKFFNDTTDFPELTGLFKKSVVNIQEFCLSMDKPLSMSVSHVYPDCASFAAKNSLIMDGTYESHAAKRGLI